MGLPNHILTSQFFHARSNDSDYSNALNYALDKLLPDSFAYISYAKDDQHIILISKRNCEIHKEIIPISSFTKLKDYLIKKRKDWKSEYKIQLNFIYNFELTTDQPCKQKFGPFKVQAAIKNLNEFLKTNPSALKNIFGDIKLPNKAPYLCQELSTGYYLLYAPLCCFIISSNEIQQLINLTYKSEAEVNYLSNSTQTPDEFYNQDANSQLELLFQQSLEQEEKAAAKKTPLKLNYSFSSDELSPPENKASSEQPITQSPSPSPKFS